MPKNCINCQKPISGDGKNKVFCDDCLQKISPFLKFISQSKVPAKKLYELNFDRLCKMELSDLTLSYLEKCCVRYDEKRAAAMKTAVAAPISAAADIKTAKAVEKEPEPIPTAPVIPAETEEKPSISEISSEKEEISVAVPPKSDEKIAPPKVISPVSDEKSEYDLYGDDEDDIAIDGENDEERSDGTRRIALIIAAAVTTFIIFLALYLGGIIPGYSPSGELLPGTDSTDTVETAPPVITDEPAESESETDEPAETACPHDFDAATCTSPAVCKLCGVTDGETLGHDMKAATCTAPSTCSRCGITEGEPIGHDFTEATCTMPQVCTFCGEMNGDALDHNWRYDDDEHDNVCTYCKKTQSEVTGIRACDHDWIAATCDTAKVCRNCGETDGKALGHDWTAATCETAKTCSRCDAVDGDALGHDMKPATCTSPSSCSRCDVTEGEALGHVIGGVKCPNCGEYLVSISGIGSKADDKSGLSVVVESIESVPTANGGTIYYVKYTVTNNTADSMLEGAFKLFLEDGGGIDPPGAAYVPIDPGSSVTHTYTFEVASGQKPLILEYYSDGAVLMFCNTPHTTSDALYWAVK